MKPKRTILHLINTLGLGGAEILFANTLPLLTDYNHVVCYLSAPYDLAPKMPDYPTYCLQHTGMKGSLRTLYRLKKIIREHKPDIIHTHLLQSTWLGRMACPRRTAFAFSVHSIMSEDAYKPNPASLLMEKFTMRKRHNLIAVSETVRLDYIESTGFKGKSFVLYNFIPDSFFERNFTKAESELKQVLRCITVGNLKHVKNQVYMLQAFQELTALPIELDIYGEGPLHGELQSIIDDTGIRVQLKGTSINIAPLLQQYNVFIGTSIHEGYGLAVLEAMAACLPVILSDIPVFREITAGHALFTDLADPASLAMNLKGIINGDIETGTMVKLAYEHATQIAGKETYIACLDNIYQTIIK